MWCSNPSSHSSICSLEFKTKQESPALNSKTKPGEDLPGPIPTIWPLVFFYALDFKMSEILERRAE